jgi:rhamnose utilization protein RhaD (predicted bifunctional aldolase and dehydrogenase)
MSQVGVFQYPAEVYRLTGEVTENLANRNPMDDQRQDIRAALLKLSHELGREDRGWAILGEGNTSARIDSDHLLVKASGSSLGTLHEEDLVECRADAILALLDKRAATDEAIESTLLASRVNPGSKKPSVETLFHAYLLTLRDVHFVGHTHLTAVNQVLCSPRARQFAERRLFPDEIVCCGSKSVLVPYTDPGLRLAQAIRRGVSAFLRRHRYVPRVILVKNHGIITTGRTPEAVLAAMLMAEKSAQIWIGAASLGGPTFLRDSDVWRIAGRSDEHVRRKIMNI